VAITSKKVDGYVFFDTFFELIDIFPDFFKIFFNKCVSLDSFGRVVAVFEGSKTFGGGSSP